LIDQAKGEGAETIGLAVWVLNTVTTQPAHEKEDGNFSFDILRTSNKRAQLIAARVRYPVVKDIGVCKVFSGPRLLRKSRGLDQT
jgi:hypothetical protein